MRRALCVVAAVFNLLLVDAVAKELAAGYLRGSPPVPVIDGFFDLAYVENRGCAWGMFQGQVWPLALFGFAALVFLVLKRRTFFPPYPGSKAKSILSASAEVLLYAGIVGNMIDRLLRGYVIDFLDFHWRDAWHFPCFNVADSCITVAAAILVALSFAGEGKGKS